MYYIKNRYYDSDIKRFICSEDTNILIGDYENFAQYNLYVYCFNSPINLKDEEGMWPKWVRAAVGVVTIAGLAVVTAMTGGAAAVIYGAALTGSIIGSGVGVGIGLAVGGVVGGALAGANIASGGTQIIGSAQKTGTAFHQMASNIEAGKMAMLPGKYSKIAFDRVLKTVGLNERKRPDVIGIARYGYNRIVEVVSKSQTVLQMGKK